MISEARASALAWNCYGNGQVSKVNASETDAFSDYLGRGCVDTDSLGFLPGAAVGGFLDTFIAFLLLLLLAGRDVVYLLRLLLALQVSRGVGSLQGEGHVRVKWNRKSAGFQLTFGYFSFSPF